MHRMRDDTQRFRDFRALYSLSSTRTSLEMPSLPFLNEGMQFRTVLLSSNARGCPAPRELSAMRNQPTTKPSLCIKLRRMIANQNLHLPPSQSKCHQGIALLCQILMKRSPRNARWESTIRKYHAAKAWGAS